MREIKFRAWDKEFKKWLHQNIVNSLCIDRLNEKDSIYEFNQFTGLHDRHGKEIFEGDVLKSEATDRLYPVTWWAEKAMFRAIKGNYFLDQAKAWKNCEVIGNVYEHPELTEVGK